MKSTRGGRLPGRSKLSELSKLSQLSKQSKRSKVSDYFAQSSQ